MTAPEACASPSGDRVDLIDENDAGMILLRILKKITDTGGADTDEHLDEIRAGNREERHTCLSRNSFCDQGLARSGRSYKQDTFRDACSESSVFCRVSEEIDNFLQILLLLLKTCDILECNFRIRR